MWQCSAFRSNRGRAAPTGALAADGFVGAALPRLFADGTSPIAAQLSLLKIQHLPLSPKSLGLSPVFIHSTQHSAHSTVLPCL